MRAQPFWVMLGKAAARYSRIAALCCVASCAVAARAHADVLEINDNGEVTALTTFASASSQTPALNQSTAPPRGAAETRDRLQQAARDHDLSPELVNAVAWAESRFNDHARSPAGAIGVMQLMPGTAASLGVNPADPTQNAQGGAAYVRRMLDAFDGDLTLALAAYNAGPEAVRRHRGVPPYAETRAYVASVLDYMARQADDETGEP